VQRSQIEQVVMEVISQLTPGDEQEKPRLPLPPASQSTVRGVREDSHPDDRSLRVPSSEWQEEEGGAASPRSRFADASGNINDADRRPLSPRYRSGDTPGTAPSTPKLETRQTAPPANIEVPISGSSKRARGSDLSSEYSLAADRETFPIDESQEAFQEALRRRTKAGKRSSQSGPRPARHGSRHSAGHTGAAFKSQDPAGNRPIADIGEDALSESDTEDRARGPRQTRPYRFPGKKVQGRRYDARDVRELTPPPEVPEVPRAEVGERAWRAAGGRERDPRRVARVDSWSDDREEERWNVARSPPTMGR
jgi:hypothetical protein